MPTKIEIMDKNLKGKEGGVDAYVCPVPTLAQKWEQSLA